MGVTTSSGPQKRESDISTLVPAVFRVLIKIKRYLCDSIIDYWFFHLKVEFVGRLSLIAPLSERLVRGVHNDNLGLLLNSRLHDH